METKIYLVRHGETDWNKQRRFQGQKDIPLNDFGEIQAGALAQRLKNSNYRIDKIYSSDLMRAKTTADFIALKYGEEVNIHQGLRERGFGVLEGVRISEIKQKYPDVDLSNIDSIPELQVEPFETFKNRLYSAIHEIVNMNINNEILIVSHGAAINSFLFEISNGSLGSGKTKITNTSVTTVIYKHTENDWVIEEVNDTTHMEAI